MGKKILTAEELAAELKLKPRTIRAWAQQKKIPSLRISPKVLRFDLDEVQRSLNSKFQIKTGKSTVLEKERGR